MDHQKLSRLGLALSAAVMFSCDSDPTAGRVSDAGNQNDASAQNGSDAGPMIACVPTSNTETSCSGKQDDDCDGFTDCLDPDCESKACGGDGYSCLAGACLTPGALPVLPRIDNVVATIRGDNVIVDFSPVQGALDYRIYPLPADSDVLVGQDGEVSVANAVYRCAGALPRDNRKTDQVQGLNASFEGNASGFARTMADSVLGYVYLTPGADREAVYRVANPNQVGGYPWEYQVVPAKEYNAAAYVQGTEARDALVAKGWRNDGVAFYVATASTVPVYFGQFAVPGGDTTLSVFYVDGPEKTSRDAQTGGTVTTGFKVLAAKAEGSVPLHRVFYWYHDSHDVLAAGDVNLERVLYQGNMPATTLYWPSLTKETTLVIEALDNGCPFPNGYIAAMAAPKQELEGVLSEASVTLDQARLSSGEVFVNGQYPVTNRPKPIARAYVTVQPEPHPTTFDWWESFDMDKPLAPFETIVSDNIGTRVFRNGKLSVEFQQSNDNFTYGQVLGQFLAGSVNSFQVVAMGADAKMQQDSYLHVTMTADIVSTARRYPQIFITDAPLGDPKIAGDITSDVLFQPRLGPLGENPSGGPYHTLIIQPFGGQPELQVEFCDGRGWGVSMQCPRANIHGFHAGDGRPEWKQPWLPLPVLGEYAAMDRMVKLDVLASTDRVYVYLENQPAGCAKLPQGHFPAGGVNVIFGVASYHIDVDEFVQREPSRIEYWKRFALAHTDRKLDDLGIKTGAQLPKPGEGSLPAWDEARMPCGDKFYGP